MGYLLQSAAVLAAAIPDTGEARTLRIVIPLLAVSAVALAAVLFFTRRKKK